MPDKPLCNSLPQLYVSLVVRFMVRAVLGPPFGESFLSDQL